MHVLTADDAGGSTLGILTIALPLLGIALPILIAYARGVVNKVPTIILSILLGWSCIGAIVPLIVAVSARTTGDIDRQAAANAVATAAALEAYQRGQQQPPQA